MAIKKNFLTHEHSLDSYKLYHLNKAPHFCESVPHLLNTSTNENINQPFSMKEVKFGIKQLKVDKAGRSDIILNDFLKYCHYDCRLFKCCVKYGLCPIEWGITLLSCTIL